MADLCRTGFATPSGKVQKNASLNFCTPDEALWRLVPDGVCNPVRRSEMFIAFQGVVEMAGDLSIPGKFLQDEDHLPKPDPPVTVQIGD